MKRILLIATVFLVFAGLGQATPAVAAANRSGTPGVHGDVWVTNKSLNTVTVFSASTGQVRGTMAVGSTPIEVIIPHGTGKAYVSNEGSNSVSVFDAHSLAPLKTIPMGLGPHHMMPSPDARRLYVGDYNGNTVDVIDTTSDTEIARYVTSSNPNSKTHAVFVSHDGSTLYATNVNTNEMVVLDAWSGVTLWRLTFDGFPSEVLLSKDERRAFVSIRPKNAIAVVDLQTRSVLAEPFIGVMPDTLRLTPDGKTVVVALRGTPAEMSLLDTETLSMRPIDLAGTTTGHQWLTPNGKYTFISIEGPGSVALVNNETGVTEATYQYPGGGKPHGVFFMPAQGDEG